MKKLESGIATMSASSSKFDITKYINLVPAFQEKDVDQYFLHFEKIAENMGWPKEFWTMLLQSVLLGKAREIYTQLSVEQAANYDFVKDIILKGYELVPEAYRQRFRNWEKGRDQTYVEFARVKEQLFDRWCSSHKVDKDHEKLRQLVLIEEFKRCIHSDVRTFIDEQKADTLDNAARLADDYSLTHKVSYNNTPSQSFTFRNNQQSTSKGNYSPANKTGQNQNTNKPPSNYKSNSQTKTNTDRQFNKVTCGFCHKSGHVLSECWSLKRKREEQNNSKPTGLCITHNKPMSVIKIDQVQDSGLKDNSPLCNKSKVKTSSPQNEIMELFEPFIHSGLVSLSSDLCNATPIKILRDTGASQSLVLADILPFSESSFSGFNVLIKGVDSSDYVTVPLHDVHLSSDLVSGPVRLGVRQSLPFEGVHLLLGNDLAGDKVIINPLVTDKPCLDQTPDPIENEVPDLFPACVVTRAMSKKTSDSQNMTMGNKNEVDLSDSFLTELFSGDSMSENKPDSSIPVLPNSDKIISSSQLIAEQHKDPDISCIFERALQDSEMSEDPVCYYTNSGILMRKWRPPDASVDDDWLVKYQIVIPKPYRMDILRTAHETPLAGHLGINKTYHKILNHFYWPGIRKDVVEFCRSCHTCQVVGKPNQAISKAPLQPIPAIGEPISRILTDCGGPLPKTKPRKSLVARDFGPYIIDKKLSDLNYDVKTPDRRKSQELCHVNMFEPYLDRHSTEITDLHTVNVSFPFDTG